MYKQIYYINNRANGYAPECTIARVLNLCDCHILSSPVSL